MKTVEQKIEECREHLKTVARDREYGGMPTDFAGTFIRYFVDGEGGQGDFARAILEDGGGGDNIWLMNADGSNKPHIVNYAMFISHHFASASYGSEKNVDEWIKRGGYAGLMREQVED